ncbi:hypothetical protein [Burkholderia pseudomallei]|uniref:hypothetical protein n=1 Tax=Burkholderia pseudomallei TaxID=28450 RepID=UPI000F0977F0|nr:hypothetical protein [Burkholderia pseudomallei]CAJ3075504.1 Uncharacterised protein [Burkholderia pseudomallei]VCK72604.1 Uncharacterised protein [Burkholderia pseudomallei]VCK79903.1 Uncharacterised protein [Burkholderia pseudomallei]VCK80104.1 Uncharacterised protein [Burkholderia pseudomallei]VCK80694.1 Uncharacterised protein [Burkholderia pseudomallei]
MKRSTSTHRHLRHGASTTSRPNTHNTQRAPAPRIDTPRRLSAQERLEGLAAVLRNPQLATDPAQFERLDPLAGHESGQQILAYLIAEGPGWVAQGLDDAAVIDHATNAAFEAAKKRPANDETLRGWVCALDTACHLKRHQWSARLFHCVDWDRFDALRGSGRPVGPMARLGLGAFEYAVVSGLDEELAKFRPRGSLLCAFQAAIERAHWGCADKIIDLGQRARPESPERPIAWLIKLNKTRAQWAPSGRSAAPAPLGPHAEPFKRLFERVARWTAFGPTEDSDAEDDRLRLLVGVALRVGLETGDNRLVAAFLRAQKPALATAALAQLTIEGVQRAAAELAIEETAGEETAGDR